MFIPISQSLARPFVHYWRGASGRVYGFAVVRAQPLWLEQPSIFAFARHDEDGPEMLFVGEAERIRLDSSPEIAELWNRARALGMTHVHLNFETPWAEARRAVVADLCALQLPMLEAPEVEEPQPTPKRTPNNVFPLELALERRRRAGAARRSPAPPAEIPAAASPDVEADRGAPIHASPPPAVATQRAQRPATATAPRGVMAWLSRAFGAGRSAQPAAEPARDDPLAIAAAPEARVRDAAERRLSAVPPAPATDAGAPAVAATPEAADRDDDGCAEVPAATPRATAADARARLGLSADAPVILFAGGLDHDAGADIFAEALQTTLSTDAGPLAVIAGEGPLRRDMERRLHDAGLGDRCRFVGELDEGALADHLRAATFLAIPARAPQPSNAASAALDAGLPVLTTHAARIEGVVHDRNGLVAYDNPNSLVWGLREMLARAPRLTPADRWTTGDAAA